MLEVLLLHHGLLGWLRLHGAQRVVCGWARWMGGANDDPS